MHFAISGISTDVGKTIVSAIFCQAYGFEYWKPIQSGTISDDDTATIRDFVSDQKTHPCSVLLKEPLSPHAAAAIEGVVINPDTIKIPTSNHLLVEMAGGLMVPINDNGYLYSDFLVQHNLPTVLVSRHYLGSINHTLLSVELLKQLNIPLLGIIFVGAENKSTEEAILKNANVDVYHRIPIAETLSKSFIAKEAESLKKSLFSKIFNE